MYPKLRWPLDIRLEKIEEQEVLILSCPLGISPQPLILVPEVAPVLSCFEGNMKIDEILEKFSNAGLQREALEDFISLLDKNLFLATPRFFAAEKQIREEFISSPVRKSSLAGLGYSSSPQELAREVDGYIARAGRKEIPKGKIAGIVSPHIDYRRGGAVYGATYANLDEGKRLYVMLGTGHQYSRRVFHLTRKDFATPLGAAVCDNEFVTALATAHGWERSFADEFIHKREHSLELQLPFLLRRDPQASIAPILVGSFHEMIRLGKYPEEYDEYESLVSSLAGVLKERISNGEEICLLAAVDMAHVGTHFGDSSRLTPSYLQTVRDGDMEYLNAVRAQDKKRLFANVAAGGDSRHVCGFPSMYVFIDLFDRMNVSYEFSLFSYEQSVDLENDRCVTFAGGACYYPADPGVA